MHSLYNHDRNLGMSVTIRPATPDDAPTIARLKQEVWPDDTADSAEIASAIQHPDHASHIAFMENEPAGFIDGFTTNAANGVLRWEADLLAVVPAYRGQGIGTQLIQANIEAGKSRSVAFCRALVRVSNLSAERAFERAGYTTDGSIYALYVTRAASEVDSAVVESAHFVPVCTFGYSGIWLEGKITGEAVRAARALSARLEGQIAGAVIARDDTAAIWTAQAAGCDYLADFCWWLT
jgi:[ribosomal protein S18]-alanine N-acetyltransferase